MFGGELVTFSNPNITGYIGKRWKLRYSVCLNYTVICEISSIWNICCHYHFENYNSTRKVVFGEPLFQT